MQLNVMFPINYYLLLHLGELQVDGGGGVFRNLNSSSSSSSRVGLPPTELQIKCHHRDRDQRNHEVIDLQRIRYRQTDRQTDILLTEKKSHYRLFCHRNERDICTCIYKIVSLLKSYDNIHGMTYTTKIMLSGIAKIKLGISII